MGGNNSYGEDWGGVPKASRTHTDTHFRVEGHKVVFYTDDPKHKTNILKSNSPYAIYLIATKSNDGTVTIKDVNVFEGHDLHLEINLVFDDNGNIVPYDGTAKGSHGHRWQKNDSDGKLKRKKHDRHNFFRIDHKYDSLISKIESFNTNHKKYENHD